MPTGRRPGERLSLRARAALGLVGLGVVLSVNGYALEESTRDLLGVRSDFLQRIQPAADAANQLVGHIIDQESGQRGFLITGNTLLLAPYTSGRAGEARDLDHLDALLSGTPLAGQVAGVRSSGEAWRTQAAEPEISARRLRDVAEVVDLVRAGPGGALFAELRGRVSRLQADVATLRRSSQDEITQRLNRLRAVQGVTGLLLVLLLLAAGVLGRRWVFQPMRGLQHSLRQVAAGDLTAPVTTRGPREFLELADDGDAMRRRILAELEEATAAREALEQRGPVVAGLRQQLVPAVLHTVDGLTVHGALHAAEGLLAGDWYDTQVLPGGRLALAIADVSGHGAAAGLVAARVKHAIITALRMGASPRGALAAASTDFAQDDQDERFASAWVAVADPGAGTLTWASAGHPPALLVGPEGRCTPLGPTGPVLSGIFATPGPASWDDWSDAVVELPRGATLTAVTDGVLEARGADGLDLGDRALTEMLTALVGQPPHVVVERVIDLVRATGAGWRRDDITVLTATRT